MFLYQGKKINVYAQLTINDVQYPAGYFVNAEARTLVGIVEMPDPIYPDDRFYFWSENVDGTISSTARSLEDCKAVIRRKIATDRYEKEIGGVTLANGTMIATDRESQAKLSGALLHVQRNPTAVIDWKAQNGWVSLTKTGVEEIADIVASHVQACFSEEKVKLDQLEALTTVEEVIALA